jgi:copper transport protein
VHVIQARPLIEWPEPIVEYLGFLAQFVALGAVGFRYAAVRDRLRATAGDGDVGAFYADACARAARIGVLGALLSLILFAFRVPESAARAHTTVPLYLTHDLGGGLQALGYLLAFVGLALAGARIGWGWPIAVLGAVGRPLSGIVSGDWTRLVNPVHRLVGGLWIGTLFILVVAALVPLLRRGPAGERRGAIAADLVNGFSPLALVSAGILVLSGLTTAYRHLTPLSSLVTTPYGWTLLVKLTLVAVVFAFGAWNWRRQRPRLGSEVAAVSIHRSATRELAAAALVLAATAILVSLPSPRRAAAPTAAPATGTPASGPPASGTPASTAPPSS